MNTFTIQHEPCCDRQKNFLVDETQEKHDIFWMQKCLEHLPQDVENQHEVPISAIIINKNNKLIAIANNQPIKKNDPTAHAEIQALRQACSQQNNYRLDECSIYITLEPCPMCFFALIQARIKRIIFAAKDNKIGILSQKKYEYFHQACNHHFQWTYGICQEAAEKKLYHFFQSKRTKKTK
ncbi:MAG: nucleoside deaminase [Pseudomonadota bacterium]|nr:nucleoside deaminase [Pseudomonadota bacterium]